MREHTRFMRPQLSDTLGELTRGVSHRLWRCDSKGLRRPVVHSAEEIGDGLRHANLTVRAKFPLGSPVFFGDLRDLPPSGMFACMFCRASWDDQTARERWKHLPSERSREL